MKILLITHSFAEITHGPAKFARLLYQLNKKEGISVKILTEAPTAEPNIYAVIVKPPRLFQAFIKVIRSWHYRRRAQQIQADFPFDIIIFNDAITAFFTALKPFKQVKTIGMLNDSANIYPYYPSDKPLRKKLIRRLYHAVEKITVKKMDGTICCSYYLQKLAKKTYQSLNQYGLYQSVSLEDMPPLKAVYKLKDPIQILFVKHDYITGGLSFLLQAAAQLRKYAFEITIVGPSPDIVAKLEQWRGDNTKIVALGAQPQAAVFQLMAQSDLLCIPSLHEGLGVANIEGLAMGLPVVSTNTGGIPEVLDYGRLGWLATPGNADYLASKIEACISATSSERMEKARLGRMFVEQKFGHDKMLANLLTILNTISGKNYPH